MNEPRQTEADAPVEELRDDIAQTRQELGETVEALAAKTDVKRRAKGAAQQAVASARERGRQAAVVARERGQKAAVAVRERGQAASAQLGESARHRPAVWVTMTTGLVAAVAASVGIVAWQRRRRRPQRRPRTR